MNEVRGRREILQTKSCIPIPALSCAVVVRFRACGNKCLSSLSTLLQLLQHCEVFYKKKLSSLGMSWSSFRSTFPRGDKHKQLFIIIR